MTLDFTCAHGIPWGRQCYKCDKQFDDMIEEMFDKQSTPASITTDPIRLAPKKVESLLSRETQFHKELWALAGTLSRSDTDEGAEAYQTLTQLLFKYDIPYINDITHENTNTTGQSGLNLPTCRCGICWDHTGYTLYGIAASCSCCPSACHGSVLYRRTSGP